MPELPEIETIRRDLEGLSGQTLSCIQVKDSKFLRRCKLKVEDLNTLQGQKLISLSRKGKFLFFHFSQAILYFHLGLTGSLILHSNFLGKATDPKEILRLYFDERGLVFSDVRKFGRIGFFHTPSEYDSFLEGLGPDALSLTLKDFSEIIRKGGKGPIKRLLLDQKKIAGLGNIYADEILFRAKISPLRSANLLTAREVQTLYDTMRAVLKQAVSLRGSSVKDYLDGLGRPGEFQKYHLVYRKYGQPCPVCSFALQRIEIASRTTTFCPQCQK